MLVPFKTRARRTICICPCMTRKLFLAIAIAALSITPTRGEGSGIGGVWEAKFKGTIFLTIKLNDTEPITGSICIGAIGVDYQGKLLAAESAPPECESPILRATLDGQTLRFEIDDDGELTWLEIVFSNDGKAVMKFPDLAQKIEPVILERK